MTGNTDWSWRFPLSLQVVSASLTILLSSFLPGKDSENPERKLLLIKSQDSPRALVKQNRMEEARDVIDMLSLEPDPVKRENATVSDQNNCLIKSDIDNFEESYNVCN